MAGVGKIQISKNLGEGGKLQLHMGWESDEGLLERGAFTDGNLPGSGLTSYLIEIEIDKESDPEQLQEFRFRGGGDLSMDDIEKIPLKVKQAYDRWFVRLSSKNKSAEIESWKENRGEVYHADAAARGENPYYPGLPAPPPGGYRYPNPTGVWKTEARKWLESHPNEHTRVSLKTVEDLYRAGALNVDITFDAGQDSGCEVSPPRDTESRRKLIAVVRSLELEYIQTEEGDYTKLQGDDRVRWEAQRAHQARVDELLARETSDKGPWTVY